MSWFRRRTDSHQTRGGATDVDEKGGRRISRFRLIFVTVLAALVVIGWPRAWLQWQLYSSRKAMTSGHLEAALESLKRAVEYAPGNAEAQYRLAVAERRSGHLDRVAPPLERALKLGWPKAEIDRQKLLTIAQSGDVDSVDAPLKALMQRGAGDEAAEEICEAMAIGFLKTYRLKEAWVILTYWSEWQPKAVFPKFWRADICRRSENTSAEEREYRDILKIDPGHAAARCRLAEVLKDSNRIEEAAREYERCLTQGPRNPDVLIGLVECRRRMGNSAAAVPLVEQALGLTLSSLQRATALEHWGQIEADGGRWNDAIRHLEEAVRLVPYKSSTLFALAQAHASAGDSLRAQELSERSRFVSAQHERVAEITRVLLDHPGDAGLRCEAGKILLELGAKAEGEVWLKTALQTQPNHQGALDALAALRKSEIDPNGQAPPGVQKH